MEKGEENICGISSAKCYLCGHQWVAVYPGFGAPKILECPKCRMMMGSIGDKDIDWFEDI